MKIGELKDLIRGIPDDFEFEISVETKMPEDELKDSSYPYPYSEERFSPGKKDYDIGWSNKSMFISVRAK